MRVNADQPVAVVTGGNRGVGREVCRQLALLGFSVVLEVDNSVSVASMAEWVKNRFGRTDVLVNNASTMYDRWATASNADLGTVAEAIDVNLFGPWRVIDALLPMLRSSTRPRIINVSSEGGSISVMTGGSPAYSVSKAALNALTRLLAAELARDGILVNAVCPGWPASENHPDGRSITQAAASVIWAVTIPNGGPTGTLTRDGQPYPW
jgi:NAD(P)-dependent dehydrogenase (short-subunit alcohol dehydrogenase family)